LEGGEVHFELSKLTPVKEDPRELGLMIRRILSLEDRRTMERVGEMHRNKILNSREFRNGAGDLASFPPLVRIGVESRCNIKPRCVYCDWERAKDDEARSDFRFSLRALEEMGEFYERAERIGELGYGEPMLHEEFNGIVKRFHSDAKPFSLASNGLALDERARKALLGMDVELYISLDAASAASYRRYRNDEFSRLMRNIEALCRAKKDRGGLPAVIVSFIAMRSNVCELVPLLDLLQEVGVDGVRVMGLDSYPSLLGRVERRGGHLFRYAAERLSFDELLEFALHAREEARRRSLGFLSVTDFGSAETQRQKPLCSEPWETMNILNRGIVSCCNNKAGILAHWSERGNRTVRQFLHDVWNGNAYRSLRRSLADGLLPEICRTAGSCAIAAKALAARSGPSASPPVNEH
jgi:MoaA/NifB/PqqE/SkfB family radical SAM enzyme